MSHSLSSQPVAAEVEEAMLAQWQQERVLEKLMQQNATGKPFIFFDGPPTANAAPGLHHLLPGAFKDAVCRYQSMQGKQVLRQPGWDTHGLPVEVQVEKAMGLASKKDVLSIVPGDESASIIAFNKACKDSVWSNKQDWDRFIPRGGREMEFDKPYITYDASYIQGVWSVFKQIWEKNLVFKSYKVLPYCPRCGTGLSAAEVALEYQDVKDVSVFVSFPLVDAPDTSFIAWTTTPWTLPGHVALALGKDIVYATIAIADKKYILAKDRLEIITEEYTIVDEKLGSELTGIAYQPIFPGVMDAAEGKKFITVLADFVTTTDGSGIVHTACMYGEDDFNLGKELGLAMSHTVDLSGSFLPHVAEFAGMNVREALVPILKSLTEKGKLFKKQTITHSYPHCWRCKTPLIYYAKDSWYIRMSSLRSELMKSNSEVRWIPDHLQEGRFGDFIREARDWAISRERFWGTPLPIWVSESGKQLCIGSFEELRSLAVDATLLPSDFDPHRPFMDDIVLTKDGEEYRREPYVLDVWFDSGAMPFASGRFERGEYPADFIAEAIDQTRGWFYSLMAIGTILTGKSSYKNVICMGHLVDENGRKMSKSLGNILKPFDVFAEVGADAARLFMFTVNAPGEQKAISVTELKQTYRRFMIPLWNMTSYLQTYAEIAGVDVAALTGEASEEDSTLDAWVRSRQSRIINAMTLALDDFDLQKAGRLLEDHITELSTWYLRRSRKREDLAFFSTLTFVLRETCRLMAPLAPFHSDYLYQELGSKQSVHLSGWPVAGSQNTELETEMELARSLVEVGLALRSSLKIKVRQPLAAFYAQINGALSEDISAIIADELNVESVWMVSEFPAGERYPTHTVGNLSVAYDALITPELAERGDARELLRNLQQLRKTLGFKAGEKLLVRFGSDHSDYLKPMLSNQPFVLSEASLQLAENAWEVQGSDEISLSGRTIFVGFERIA